MFDAPFEHYLTYGATDQQTVRALSERFTGLILPGTVAAFQREGTGGFVLALSAAKDQTPYVIDPRFPLFQQPLPQAKKSQIALAKIMGEPDLVGNTQPLPGFFTPARIDSIASNWAKFNLEYRKDVSAKFKKYADKLQEHVIHRDSSGPKYVLPPYMVCTGSADKWWEISDSLFERTVHHVGDPEKCVRVVAAKQAPYLHELLGAANSDRAAIWVSGLDEFRAPADDLAKYADAIRKSEKRLFALYGGFFSVLLSSVGLGGSCHGIGFGEHRLYLELPQSGPPPSRYYLPRLHRYISTELAFQLYESDPALAECECRVCDKQPPIDLDYHQLMMHSVLCRAHEIKEWIQYSLDEVVVRLEDERGDFFDRLLLSSATDIVRGDTRFAAAHLQIWINALRSL